MSPAEPIPMPLLPGRRVALVGKLASMSKREAAQLLRRHGATVLDAPSAEADLVVVGEEGLPIGESDELDLLLDGPVRQSIDDGRTEVLTETRLWQRLGLVDAQQEIHRLYTPAMLAGLLGVPVAVIRRWQRRGLIVPTREVRRLAYFDFQEVATARRLAELLAAGMSRQAIERKLAALARFLPGVERPLAQLSVIVQGKEILLRQGDGLIEPGGQLRFDFEAAEDERRAAERAPGGEDVVPLAGAVAPRAGDRPASATDFCEMAAELEESGQLHAAAEMYRAALAAGGPRAEISFQLAELLYRLGDLAAARERYYMTIELDEDYVEARANLGCVLAEMGQLELAVAAFEGALRYHPDYADAHYHLARALDDLGRADEAARHWRVFWGWRPRVPGLTKPGFRPRNPDAALQPVRRAYRRAAARSRGTAMDFFTWTYFFLVGEWIIRLVMPVVIVLRKEPPTACLVWLAIIFLEPWAGLVFYLLVGENRLGRRRLARRRRRHYEFVETGRRGVEPEHVLPPIEPSGEHHLHLAVELGGLPVVGGNRIEFTTATDVAIEDLIADIDQAEHHVHLLFYIFAADRVGRRVSDALVRACRRGVVCRLLADGVGSRRFFRTLAPELRAQGVKTAAALPVNVFRLALARLDLRNHRKLAVIDGRVAYTGSQNIIRPTYGHRRAGVWHDIMARIQGPVVQQLQDIFLEDWFQESGELVDDPAYFPPAILAGPVPIQVVPTGPDLATGEFQDLVMKAIFLARHRVVITSPYFVPSEAMLLALRLAAQRRVQVDLVIPRKSDHPIIDAAGAFYCAHLMRYGVRVFRYERGMLHAKTLTADDRFAMFGSANYDIRSFTLNFELNLVLHHHDTVARLRAVQEHYIRDSQLAEPGRWPNPSFAGRLRVNLAKLLSPLL